MSVRSPRSTRPAPPPPLWARVLGQHIIVVAFLAIGVLGMLYIYTTFTRTSPRGAQAVVATPSGSAISGSGVTGGAVRQRVRQSPAARQVGIVAGHMDYDPGAVCSDGLTEATVNLAIARQVIAGLQGRDISAELLAEYDPRLNGYAGLLLLSIHADSCEDYGASFTGFKLAAADSPGSQRLADCIYQAYQTATQLPYHPDTVTSDMTDYHAFREIAPTTPAVIIETGFLNRDRALLTARADLPAAGIVAGIACYLEAQP